VKVEISFDPADLCLVREPHPAPETPVVHEEQSTANPKTRQLALAYHIHALIASGEMKDIAHVARVAGVSRARISQVLNMALLEPGIQETVLDVSCPFGSHELRRLAGMIDWGEQKRWTGRNQEAGISA
jgi:hypothetical protein